MLCNGFAVISPASFLLIRRLWETGTRIGLGHFLFLKWHTWRVMGLFIRHFSVLFSPSQTSTRAQLTDSNARTTAASPCGGSATGTMTAATMKTSPTQPVLVRIHLYNVSWYSETTWVLLSSFNMLQMNILYGVYGIMICNLKRWNKKNHVGLWLQN